MFWYILHYLKSTVTLYIISIALQAHFNLQSVSSTLCHIHPYVNSVASTYSAWLVVALGVERYIVVWFPLKSKYICTKRKAVAITCVLFLILAAARVYQPLVFHLSVSGKCDVIREPFALFVKPWLDATLYSYAPLVILIFLSTAIAVGVKRAEAARVAMGSAEENGNARQVTRTVLAICVSFLIFTVPITIFGIYATALGQFAVRSPGLTLLRAIAVLLAMVNHAANSYIYCIASRNFRLELRKTCICCNAAVFKERKASSSNSRPRTIISTKTTA